MNRSPTTNKADGGYAMPICSAGRRSAAPLRFEREEAVPGADVEDRAVVETLWDAEETQLLRRVVLPGRNDSVAEIDRVPPLDLGDRLTEFLLARAGNRSAPRQRASRGSAALASRLRSASTIISTR
jgi:hypothetical protein